MHATKAGSVAFPYGSDTTILLRLPETCSLDAAEKGPRSLEQVAKLMNMTRQRVHEIEQAALRRLRDTLT